MQSIRESFIAKYFIPSGWGRSSLIQGKAKSHGCALYKPVACHGNCAVVCFDYGSGNCQSETCAAYPTTTRLVSTVEAVEDVGKVCGINANTVIDDRDSHRLVAFQLCREHDIPARLGAMNGVDQDVSQRLAHAHPIEVHVRQNIGYQERQLNLTNLSWRPPATHLSGEQFVYRTFFECESHFAVVGLGKRV